MKIYDFNNPEDFKALEQQAYDGTIEIERFPPAAYRYFDKLRTLYARFKYDNLPKETAQAMKRRLYSEYRQATEAYDRWVAVYSQFQHSIHLCHELMTKIEKSDDVQEIARLSLEAVSLLTGDEGFAQRQRNKLQKGEKQ